MSEYQEFRSTTKQFQRFEVYLRELLRRDDTLPLDLDDCVATGTIACHC